MPSPQPATGGTVVLSLEDARAADARLGGAKASNLALAAAAGLPVLPGFVLDDVTATEVARTDRDDAMGDGIDAALEAWRALSEGGRLPVVVRSSSTDEDGAESSNAGRFTSVLDVDDEDSFLSAVREVVRSANVVSMTSPRTSRMAVLVQQQVHPVRSGVAFGADPVSGRLDRRVIAAVAGRPEALVSGQVDGERTVVAKNGRVIARSGTASVLDARSRRRVLRLGRRAAELFGGPQDIEWAIDAGGRLWLLQSRPITAIGAIGRGPIFGTGPVAETFPARLRPLEVALWVEPLRIGLVEALALTSGAPARRIRTSPVVTTVDGWVAVDLELLAPEAKRRGFARLDPRPSLRRLGAAWRVGRLRAALPGLVDDLVARVDRELAEMPDPASLGGEQLLAVVERARQVLVALHGHEMLAGALHTSRDELTAASLALRELAARSPGETDAEVVARAPVVLSLLPPSIASPGALPAADDAVPMPGHADVALLPPREALRLRARWVQELMAVAVRELAARHPAEGVELDLADVALFDLDELREWCRTASRPDDLAARRRTGTLPPLPVRFQFADDGTVVAVTGGRSDGGGEAAGGGRAIGTVVDADNVHPGAILVVSSLDPRLAPLLPRLAGLVSETGSPLSHLATLAREHRVATVVGVPDAGRRFPLGATVLVDGTSGEVELVEGGEAVAR